MPPCDHFPHITVGKKIIFKKLHYLLKLENHFSKVLNESAHAHIKKSNLKTIYLQRETIYKMDAIKMNTKFCKQARFKTITLLTIQL